MLNDEAGGGEMSDKVLSLHDFEYVCGYTGEKNAERIYKSKSGLYLCIETKRRANGEWGKGKRYYSRTPNVKSSWKKDPPNEEA